jgi:hypothetical protein
MHTDREKPSTDADQSRKAVDGDLQGERGALDREDREKAEGSRFDRERQDRDRGAYENQNQGHGPSNVGDQSRTR